MELVLPEAQTSYRRRGISGGNAVQEPAGFVCSYGLSHQKLPHSGHPLLVVPEHVHVSSMWLYIAAVLPGHKVCPGKASAAEGITAANRRYWVYLHMLSASCWAMAEAFLQTKRWHNSAGRKKGFCCYRGAVRI